MHSLSNLELDLPDRVEVHSEKEWATYGNWQLVGNGKQTNGFCGVFMRFKGCLRVDLHNRISLDGVVHKNEVYIQPVHNWCNKPSCPVCYRHGWALREAGKIEMRLAEASKRGFGQVEHIVCSVPVKDYDLGYDSLRAKVVQLLFSRGVVGAALVFHAFRYSIIKQWYFSPHYHALGFLADGYSCRLCKRKNNCIKGCGGFDDRSYQAFLRDGYYVKVLGKRKTVFGTAWYELNHSSIDVTKERFHVAVWFGVCSYRKMKLSDEVKERFLSRKKSVCPICRYELERVRYFGGKHFVVDRCAVGYRQKFFADYLEDGRVVWFPYVEPVRYGSGSYEDL